MANRSCDWLEYEKNKNPNSPLLLTVNFPAPHGPEDAAPSWQTVFNSTRQPINLENYNYVNNEKKHSLLRKGSNVIKFNQNGHQVNRRSFIRLKTTTTHKKAN